MKFVKKVIEPGVFLNCYNGGKYLALLLYLYKLTYIFYIFRFLKIFKNIAMYHNLSMTYQYRLLYVSIMIDIFHRRYIFYYILNILIYFLYLQIFGFFFFQLLKLWKIRTIYKKKKI